MCGIAGYVGQTASREGIRKVLNAIRHRGPDDEGMHVSPAAWLGHRRLSIIDVSGGHQPIGNEDGSVWIVCNGEIYNYRALRQELVEKGHRFSTHSDTEVVLHLYEELGTKCVESLRGMFAFAIWDEKKKRLFAARDRLGQKPFYYWSRGKEFGFASEIKGLLAFDQISRELNLEALDQYFALRVIAPPRSMFRGIHKLAPGHYLTFDPDSGVRTERYWDPQFEPKWPDSEDDLVDQLEELLIENAGLHMVSDVEVGAFLSGGLDSTLALALATKHTEGSKIRTFSMGLPYGDFDEAPYARMVAERYGTRHYEKQIVPSLTENLPDLIYFLDEPSDPLSVCTYLLSRMAREHVKVVFGGDGGDELFGGYDRYYGNVYAGLYAGIPEAVRRHAIGPLLGQLSGGKWYKSKAHQLKWLHRASFMSGGERYAQTLGYFYFGADLRDRLYGPEMTAQIRHFDPYADIREAYERAPAEHPIDRMLYADDQIRLPDHSVMILDRTSMAHGLEVRSPFMDHKVAEFAARLPVRLKVRGRTLRYIQQRLCERYLPEAVLKRRKQGFSSALPYMLAEEYRLLSQCFLKSSRLAEDGILRQPEIDRLVREHDASRADHGNRLWLLVNSEAWYRMHIHGQTREDLAASIAEAAHGQGRAMSASNRPYERENVAS